MDRYVFVVVSDDTRKNAWGMISIGGIGGARFTHHGRLDFLHRSDFDKLTLSGEGQLFHQWCSLMAGELRLVQLTNFLPTDQNGETKIFLEPGIKLFQIEEILGLTRPFAEAICQTVNAAFTPA